MRVVLKAKYKNDLRIDLLNQELTADFGANTCVKFNTWQYLQQQADYMNGHREGKKQMPQWKRPITKEMLHDNFFCYRVGEFTFKLSGEATHVEARDAVAVCKWLIKTRCRNIDKKLSKNYSLKILRQYLDWIFIESGYDIDALWQIN